MFHGVNANDSGFQFRKDSALCSEFVSVSAERLKDEAHGNPYLTLRFFPV